RAGPRPPGRDAPATPGAPREAPRPRPPTATGRSGRGAARRRVRRPWPGPRRRPRRGSPLPPAEVLPHLVVDAARAQQAPQLLAQLLGASGVLLAAVGGREQLLGLQ